VKASIGEKTARQEAIAELKKVDRPADRMNGNCLALPAHRLDP
jgi:hypothetical protein